MRPSGFLSALIAAGWLFSLPSAPVLADEGQWSKVRIQVPEKETLHRILRLGVDLEGSQGKPGGAMECIISGPVLRRLQEEGTSIEVLIPDLEAHYETRLTAGPVNALGFGYGSMGGYYTLEEVQRQLDTLRLLHPQVVGIRDSIGASLQGRPIWAVRMTANPDAPSIRPQVLFLAMHHAREPMGMMTLLYFMWHLAQGYGSDPEVTYLLENRDLWFIPVMNVDGYEANRRYMPNGGGMRRKNMRNAVSDNDLNGVDLCRNWDSHWAFDDIGSSPDPLDLTYRGTAPFSEPEAQVLRDFYLRMSFRFIMEYHSYGNMTLCPPGYTEGETPDSAAFREYLPQLTRDNHFSYGPGWVLYPINGIFYEWAYEHPQPEGTVYPFVTEVGTTNDGFWPASSRILPLASGNLFANLFCAWSGGAYPRFQRCTVVDSNADGDYEGGEPITAEIKIRNFGVLAATGTTVSLRSTSPWLDIALDSRSISTIESNTDTVVRFTGRVKANVPGGTAGTLIVSVSPDHQLDFHDTVSIVLGKRTILFADDAEHGVTNWTTNLGWGTSSNAHWGNWSFTDSPAGNYRVNSTGTFTLRTPVSIPLTSVSTRLQFWTRWNTEASFDFGQVQYSADGGVTWAPLKGKFTSFSRGEGYSGWEPSWLPEDIDLSFLAGKSVQIRLVMDSDAGTTKDGWYVDDIVIKSYTATGSRLAPVQAADFSKVVVGEPDTLAIVLRSIGTSALTVTGVDHRSDAFILANAPLLPVSIPGTLDSLVLHVVFNPASHGPATDTLLVTSNDPIHPIYQIPLAGAGVDLGSAGKYRMYAASGAPGSSLFHVDPETGEATVIGPMETPEMQTLCVRDSTNELYGTALGSGALQLFRLSTEHGTAVPALNIPLPGSRAVAFSPGSSRLTPGRLVPPDQLYVATTSGKLYTVDRRSGDTTLVGIAPGVKYTAMTFNPRTGDLWAADYSGTHDIIVKVDPLTADTQFVGRTGDGRLTLALSFDDRGSLFALKSAGSRNLIFQVDTSTGVGTLTDTVSAAGIVAMTINPFIVSVSPQHLAEVPQSFALEQNYPNPFNPSTTIQYSLPERTYVTLTVFNTLGQEVTTLVEGERDAGYHEVKFDASRLPSGVYFYRLHAGNHFEVRKALLMR